MHKKALMNTDVHNAVVIVNFFVEVVIRKGNSKISSTAMNN